MHNVKNYFLHVWEDSKDWKPMHAKVKRWLVISGVLFLISLIGFITVFAQSSEVEQQTKLLDYEHRGRFNYLAYQKASYLFDDILPETSPETEESQKYPVGITERFDMSFTHWLVPDQDDLVTGVSGDVEVKAVLDKSGGTEEVVLVPKTGRTGPLHVVFSLDAGELALSPTTTITARVDTTIETATGPVFESFTQSLTIKSEELFLEVDEGLRSTKRASFGELSYEQIGEFDYSVRLKADSPWGAITISPPPPPLSSKISGPGDTIFLNLLDRIDATFYYRLAANRPLNQVATEVAITAVLEATGLWSKRFPLVSTEKSGDFNVGFTLDLFHYLELLDIIRGETGASAESYSLSLTADVHTIAETDFGPIDEVFSQTLSTALEGGTLEWKGELVQTQPGSIQKTELVPNPNRYLGLSLAAAKISSAALMGVFFLPLLFSVVLYVRFKPEELSPSEEEALRVRKKYGRLMVEATVHTPMEGEITISLGSMDDLIKIADELGKPIIHLVPTTDEESHAYCVLDGVTRYRYLLSINGR